MAKLVSETGVRVARGFWILLLILTLWAKPNPPKSQLRRRPTDGGFQLAALRWRQQERLFPAAAAHREGSRIRSPVETIRNPVWQAPSATRL